MTRRRGILPLVVIVLAVGCAAPWWEDVWLNVSYNDFHLTSSRDRSVGQGRSYYYFEFVRDQHLSWLPGPERISTVVMLLQERKPEWREGIVVMRHTNHETNAALRSALLACTRNRWEETPFEAERNQPPWITWSDEGETWQQIRQYYGGLAALRSLPPR